jgi:hypothetical protein
MTERYSLGDYDLFKDVQPEIKEALDAEVPDVVPPTLDERLLAAIEQQYGPLPPAPPVTGATIRASCRFCKGRGCLNCDTLAEREYQRQFPGGPQPLATMRLDDPEDRALLTVLLHGTAEATTPAEVERLVVANATKVRAIQQRLAESDRESQP